MAASNTAVRGDATEATPLLLSPTPPVRAPFLVETSPGLFWVIFSQIMVLQFIVFFDETIMMSSHPAITSYFGASWAASWLSTSFLLASSAVRPLMGRLSDAVGRKPLIIGSLAAVLISTIWCALAGSIESLIAARAVSGLGAGGLASLSQILINDLVPIEDRGLYHPYTSMTYALGSSLGASLGGVMAERLGWRWEFGIQVPAMLLCLITCIVTIPADVGLPRGRRGLRESLKGFDGPGSVLLVVLTSLIVLSLSLGGQILPSRTHPLVITSLAAFAITLPVFLLVESRADSPVMPLELILCAPRANILVTVFILFMLVGTVLFNTPLYFRAVLLMSASSSGFRLMLPSVVFALCGGTTSFLIAYTRRIKESLVIGSALALSGLLSLTLLRRDLPHVLILVALLPTFMGFGTQNPGTIMGILVATEQAEQAVVLSMLTLARSLGQVVGIAAGGLIVQNALGHYLDVCVQGAQKDEVIKRVVSSVEAVAKLEPPYLEQVQTSYESSLRLVFLWCSLLAAISVLVMWPARIPRLPSKK